MEKHLPGPWAICEKPPNDIWYKGRTIYSVAPSEDKFSIRIGDLSLFASDEERKANGNLIIAAPDMLEALESTVGYLLGEDARTRLIHDEIRAVIAKARGG